MGHAQADSAFVEKLAKFVPLSSDEREGLAAIQSTRVQVKRGKHLTEEGQSGHKVFVLQSGWGCSFKLLPNGKRQIISFPVAGDCVGLRSVLLRTADRSFSTLTSAVVSPIEGARILKCIADFPVILTTSGSEGDIVQSYELQANCYLCKPVELDAFEALVKSINDFWMIKAKLPVVA